MEQNIAGGNTQARFRIADGVAIQSGTDWACYYNYIFCRHVVMHNLDWRAQIQPASCWCSTAVFACSQLRSSHIAMQGSSPRSRYVLSSSFSRYIWWVCDADVHVACGSDTSAEVECDARAIQFDQKPTNTPPAILWRKHMYTHVHRNSRTPPPTTDRTNEQSRRLFSFKNSKCLISSANNSGT